MNLKKLTVPIFGDTSFRGKCPTETNEQVTFFGWLRREHPEYAKIAIHIRNEGKRSVQQTMRHKVEGMVTGASDIIIPSSPTFVCELKRADHTKSTISDEQIMYLESAESKKAYACVALGHKGAIESFEYYLNNIIHCN
jgi:hypothetical protein